MPRRARKTRKHSSRVTDETVELFIEAEPLAEGRMACIRSPDMCTHDTCDRFNALSVKLHSALGLYPHQPDVFEVEDEDPPKPSAWESHYPMVREIRDELRRRAKERA